MTIALPIEPATQLPAAPEAPRSSKDGGADFERQMERTSARDNDNRNDADRQQPTRSQDKTASRSDAQRSEQKPTKAPKETNTQDDAPADAEATTEGAEEVVLNDIEGQLLELDDNQQALLLTETTGDELQLDEETAQLAVAVAPAAPVADAAVLADSDAIAIDEAGQAIKTGAVAPQTQTTAGLANRSTIIGAQTDGEASTLDGALSTTTTDNASNGVETALFDGADEALDDEAAAEAAADALADAEDAAAPRTTSQAANAAGEKQAAVNLDPALEQTGPDITTNQVQTPTQTNASDGIALTGARAAPMAEAAAAQVALAVQRNPSRNEVSIQLDPPELGSLQIRMQFTEQGSLNAVLAIDNDSTRTLMRAHESELRAALASAGFENAQFQFTEGGGRDQDQSGDSRNQAIAYDGGADLEALGAAASGANGRPGVRTDAAVDIRV